MWELKFSFQRKDKGIMDNCKFCNVELKELHYCYNNNFFDAAYGNEVWEDCSPKKILHLYRCPECGLVYALNKSEVNNE